MPRTMQSTRPSTGQDSVHVAPLRRAQVAAVGAVFAASHVDYPSFCHLFPDPKQRSTVLRTLMTDTARDALPYGAVYAATAGASMLGVAIWLPPGCFPWSPLRKLRATPAFLAILCAAPRGFPALMRLGTNTERTHPREPHWFLVSLGVRPEAQGHGLGRRLLEPVLAQADREGLPCYLTTAKEANVAFYERFGFRVVNPTLQLLPSGPTHWALRRPGRGEGA